MRNMIDYNSSFMSKVSTFCDLILLNLFFLISCLPVVTIGPAVSAMSHVTMKIVRGEEGSVWHTYWRSFRDSFRQAALFWLIFLALCLMLLADFQFFPVILPDLYRIPQIMVFFVFLAGSCVMLYLLPVVSHFQYSFRQAFRSASLMVLAHFPATVLLLALHGLCLLPLLLSQLSFLYCACYFLICGCSILSLLSSHILSRIFKRYECD